MVSWYTLFEHLRLLIVFVVTRETPDFERDEIERQWRCRSQLAYFAGFPEGYVFINRLQNGQQHAVVLLTPPDQIAVCDFGFWYRRARVEERDGPAPYTANWYADYLILNRLPFWFLTPEHLRVLDGREAARLGVQQHEDAYPFQPSWYLALRYSTFPRYPQPSPNGNTYAYDLPNDDNSVELRSLARRFPAVLAHHCLGLRRVYIDSKGYVTVRVKKERFDEGRVVPILLKGHLTWLPEDELTFRSSYQPGDTDVPRPAQRDRQGEEDSARLAGGFPDIDQMPHGVGTLTWLDENLDRDTAHALGFQNPEEAINARQVGAMVCMHHQDRPRVVFWPERRFFQPQQQPNGHGQWAFFTTWGDSNARQLARLNFANQIITGLPNTPDPTAEDIWILRQRYQGRIADGEDVDDPTSAIELVWVPGEVDTEYGIDTHSGLAHQPLNRGCGDNDQTTTATWGRYQTTRLSNDKQYTVDRSPARKGEVEPHKLWAVGKTGKWKQRRGASTFNWHDTESILGLNAWRTTKLGKLGFSGGRKSTVLVPWADDERDWLSQVVEKSSGGNPMLTTCEKLTGDFNAHFSDRPARTAAATTSYYHRLKKEYKDGNGKIPPRRLSNGGASAEAEEDQQDHEEDADGIVGEQNDEDDADGSDEEKADGQ